MLKLKSAFWGYKKIQVCEYIDSLTDEISKKYTEENEKLRDENIKLKKQLEEGSEVGAVTEIIMETKKFAEALKNKAINENNELIRRNEEAAQAVEAQIKSCDDKIVALRNQIKCILTDTDDKLNKIQQEIKDIYEQAKI